jgi:diamine N-acetyltransferase
MIIRTGTETNIPQITAIEALPQFRTYIGSWPEEQHRKTIADPDAQYLVAVENDPDQIEGFAILMGLLSEHRSIELKRIAVRTTNHGLGKKLLHAATAIAFNEHRAHRLWLDVFETNTRAQHVYEAFGFKRDGILREAVYRDGSFHSLILMSLLESEYRNLYGSSPT